MSKIGLVSTAVLCFFGAAIYHFQIKLPLPEQFEAQQSLRAVDLLNKKERPTTVQERKGVKKEIWTVKNGQRVLFRLSSKTSALTIHSTSPHFSLTEKLENLNCYMQEEISVLDGKLVQEIRTLSADKGTYFFPAHQFTTNAVDLKFFRLLGDTLPASLLTATPYLSGKAFEVTFGASDKTLQFTADYLKANLDPKQVLHGEL